VKMLRQKEISLHTPLHCIIPLRVFSIYISIQRPPPLNQHSKRSVKLRMKVLISKLCCLGSQFLQGIEIKYSTLAPTSEDLTTTTSFITSKSMASHQASSASMEKLTLPITGGSSFEPSNKKQKKEAQRRVQHVGVQGPYIGAKWSHIPIIFSQDILRYKDYLHRDIMIISCVIKGFVVHNVLVDQAVMQISYLSKLLVKCESPKISFKIQLFLFMTSKDNRWWH
jgi:hypothetical protein